MSLQQLTRLCQPRRLSIPPRSLQRIITTPTPFQRALSTTPARAVKIRVGPSRNSFAKAAFTTADVPPHGFWAALARPPLVPDLTADECLAAARGYAVLALENAPSWRRRRLQLLLPPPAPDSNSDSEPRPSLYALHYCAVMIVSGPPGPAWNLAMHILHTGVELDYAPSILTMARLALRSRKVGQPQFAPAEEALDRVARRKGGDGSADACTLKGLIHAAMDTDGDDEAALKWFRKASAVFHAGGGEGAGADTQRPRDWQWRASNALGAGRIYRKRGQAEQAKRMFEFAARELDTAEACHLCAEMLDEDDPDRLSLFQKAAISGVAEAARELGMREMRLASGEGVGEAEARERRLLADEWLGIAGDKALI